MRILIVALSVFCSISAMQREAVVEMRSLITEETAQDGDVVMNATNSVHNKKFIATHVPAFLTGAGLLAGSFLVSIKDTNPWVQWEVFKALQLQQTLQGAGIGLIATTGAIGIAYGILAWLERKQ